MENFLFSLNVVAPLFVLMATGYIVRQINFIDDDFLGKLNRFVFKFLLPIMLFQDIRLSYTGDFSNTKLIIAAVIGILVVIGVSFLIVPFFVKRKAQRGSVIQGIYRSNFLIYGLPLATGMYGDAAVASISMLMGIMIPLYNIAAVIILSIHSETGTHKISVKSLLKDIVTNPLIIGCFFGLLGGSAHLEFPRFIEIPLVQLGAIGAPLALFVMGGEFKFRRLKNNLVKIISVTFCRLILVPVVALYVFVQFGFRDVDLAVLVSIFATPTAMASYIMARNMGNDGELSAQIVVLTTALSSLTIFFLIYFLRTWGYL
ncbi:AEC family transporter [Bacteroidales bacterium OttesenSCG-928-A17]|nr:AEC family transporter [Bacteroidales bacterium OttesenSCG-928-A17]